MLYHALGLMSGTSLDGLDICHASFSYEHADGWKYRILNCETVKYPADWEQALGGARMISAEDLFALNTAYGKYLGEQVNLFLKKNGLTPPDVIGSHGHTVFHQPERGFTVQIGDGRAIKMLNDVPVVYDFRSADVLRGGNGAPLVPIGDRLLFAEYGACLNLGGFSNISLEYAGQRIAFDICPVNTVLNRFAQLLSKPFDLGGQLAATGTADLKVVQKLNELGFYLQSPPKSLGAEWVERQVLPLLEPLSARDALATFTEHAAIQISFALENYKVNNLLITGGGAYNTYLLERIVARSGCKLTVPESVVVEFKEALIFAFMAVLRLRQENNVLSSATGSDSDHCSGILV